MRYAIIESGGKQYRAVEGLTVEVDRLPAAPGAKIDLERILFMADGDEVLVGTPTLSGVQVKATVVDHIRGPKVITYKYRPKKRIRVKGGHRQQYTRLMVDFIGKPGEVRKKAEEAAVKKVEKARVEARPKAEKPAKGPKVEPKKAAPKTPAKTEKAPPAKKPAAKAPARTEKTPAASSPKGKKPAADKSSSKGKKSTTTRKSNN